MGKKNIVVVESNIRASRLQDFWRMVGDGTIDGNTFDYFLDNIGEIREKAGSAITIARVVKILGSDKIYPAEIVCGKWNITVPVMATPIRYSEATLREAARENAEGKADWRLWYQPSGLSFFRQREIRGTDSKKSPYFYPDNTWWLEAKNESWAKKAPEAGYYLADFKPRFANLDWQAQENEIGQLGEQYARTNEVIFLCAVQTIFMLTGKNMTPDWWHWGNEFGAGGGRVSVRLYGGGEVNVYSYLPGSSGDILRCSVCRRFEF